MELKDFVRTTLKNIAAATDVNETVSRIKITVDSVYKDGSNARIVM